jgi:hypothetical protein
VFIILLANHPITPPTINQRMKFINALTRPGPDRLFGRNFHTQGVAAARLGSRLKQQKPPCEANFRHT